MYAQRIDDMVRLIGGQVLSCAREDRSLVRRLTIAQSLSCLQSERMEL